METYHIIHLGSANCPIVKKIKAANSNEAILKSGYDLDDYLALPAERDIQNRNTTKRIF